MDIWKFKDLGKRNTICYTEESIRHPYPDYYAVRCKNCGRYHATQIKDMRKKVSKCVYCNTSLKLKKANEYGLTTKVFGPFTAREAALAVKKLNEGKA